MRYVDCHLHKHHATAAVLTANESALAQQKHAYFFFDAQEAVVTSRA